MGFLKIIWPWLAVAEARRAAEQLRALNRRQRYLLERAHFHDPRTGKLGRKGEVPTALLIEATQNGA